MEHDGFTEILPGIWYEIATGKPWSSKYRVGNGIGKGSTTYYDGPLKELTTKPKGYYHVWHEGRLHKWHRLVYEYFKGIIPEGMKVDHIDNKRVWDNRIENLQLLSHKENCRKALKRKDNISGYTGVSWNKNINKWRVRINVNGKNIYLGYFTCPHTAFLCYIEAKIKYHGLESILPLQDQINRAKQALIG